MLLKILPIQIVVEQRFSLKNDKKDINYILKYTST